MQNDDATPLWDPRTPDEPAHHECALDESATNDAGCEEVDRDQPQRDDDLPAWLAETQVPVRSPLRDRQFRLLGLFGLVTCFAVYFSLERAFQWQFGLHVAVGVGLVVCVALPAILIIVWMVRSIVDNGVSIGMTLLAMALLVGAAALLVQLQRNW